MFVRVNQSKTLTVTNQWQRQEPQTLTDTFPCVPGIPEPVSNAPMDKGRHIQETRQNKIALNQNRAYKMNDDEFTRHKGMDG